MATFKQPQGFTLIELMVVVVIVGILAMVALPSYNAQIVRTKRTDVMAALESAASAFERYRANNSFTFAGASLAGGSGTVLFANVSPTDGGAAQYNLTLEDANGLTVPELPAGAGAYRLRATPVAGTTQAADGVLTLDSAGRKTWNGKNCWPKAAGDCL